MNIYVGNLSFDTRDEDLRHAFEAYGDVADARVVSDRDSGRSRGFGFVEMPNSTEANAAIDGLHGSNLQGRTISANEARPKSASGGGGGGGYGGGGSRGGGGGYGGGGGRGGSRY